MKYHIYRFYLGQNHIIMNLFLTSHVYAAISLWNKATSLQKLMDGNGWNKESKCSWIKVGKKTHICFEK
jgi:hypothetical protein